MNKDIFQRFMFEYSPYDPGVTDFREAVYGYLILGLHPGSGHTAVLVGDLFGACQSLHPFVRHHLSDMARWVIFCMPPESWGSAEAVSLWCRDIDGRRSQYVQALSNQMVEYEISRERPEPLHGNLVLTLAENPV